MENMKRMLALLAAVAVLVVAAVSMAVASPGPEPAKAAAPLVAKVVTGAALVDADLPAAGEGPGEPHEGDDGHGEFFGEECFVDWEPSEEEIAEINAETDALVAHLESLGFTVTVETDELGIRYVDYDGTGGEELEQAIEDFYKAQWAEEIAAWSDEEKAEWNAHTDSFVAEMAALGIAVETEEIAPGVFDIVWTEELEEQLMDIEGEMFGDEEPFDDEAFDDDFIFEDCDEWEPTEEEIAEINAETDALVAHLESLGFTVTVETDELGIRYVDFGETDDEALWTAVDDFYRQQFATEAASWSDAEKAEWNAHIDEFVAELTELGVTVETEEIAPGVYDIIWTDEIEKALCELEGVHMDDMFDEPDFEDEEAA